MNDGTSISMLEAFAAGTPVLTSSNESNAEWIKEGISGFFFRGNSPRTLADSIVEAFKKRELFERVSQYSRQNVVTRANWAENKEKIKFSITNLHQTRR